jgi:hypothetical protein
VKKKTVNYGSGPEKRNSGPEIATKLSSTILDSHQKHLQI